MVILKEFGCYLLERVGGRWAVAAPRPLGTVVSEVLADAIPQILCRKRSLEGQRKHGEEQHWLHGHRQRTCERRSRSPGGGYLVVGYLVVLWSDAEEISGEDRRGVWFVHVTVNVWEEILEISVEKGSIKTLTCSREDGKTWKRSCLL